MSLPSGWAYLNDQRIAVERVAKFVSNTSSSQSPVVGEVQVTGMSISFTLAAAATLRISALIRAYSTVATDVLAIRVKDNGVGVVDWVKQANSASAGTVQNHDVEAWLPVAAGAHTFTLHALRAAGSGNISVVANATGPNQLRVEEVVVSP